MDLLFFPMRVRCVPCGDVRSVIFV
jgi:hypothetical protein